MLWHDHLYCLQRTSQETAWYASSMTFLNLDCLRCIDLNEIDVADLEKDGLDSPVLMTVFQRACPLKHFVGPAQGSQGHGA